MKIQTVKMFGRDGSDNDFVELDINEVNYIDLWQRTKNSGKVLAYYTADGSYLGLSTLVDAYMVYKSYGFEIVGRSVLVNQARIKSIVPSENNGSVLMFLDGSHVNVRKQM